MTLLLGWLTYVIDFSPVSDRSCQLYFLIRASLVIICPSYKYEEEGGGTLILTGWSPLRIILLASTWFIPAPQVTSANWMSGLPDRAKLFDLLIPGSHDAATSYFDREHNSSLNSTTARFTMTQDKRATVSNQLENGIRYFDFRFRKLDGGRLDQYQLYHTYFLNTNLQEVLDEIKVFLDRNPTEVVFVQLQPDGDDDDDYAILGAQEIRDTIFARYRNITSLKSKLPGLDSIPYLNQSYGNLFVEGYEDFDDILRLRKYRGLGNLGPEFNLSTTNPAHGVLDPRGGSKLDYNGLALGDVRGRVILIAKDFKGMPGHGFSDRGLNVVPLGNPSEFTTTLITQDNYDAPEFSEKKNNIYNFMQAEYHRQFPVNFTSAASSG